MPKTRPTYIYAIFSVALVLFALGFFALTALQARKLITLFKEKVDVWLELKPGLPADEVTRIVDGVKAQRFVKEETVSFITREEAEADMKAELGEESLLEEIPNVMHDIVRFNVHAEYLDNDSLLAWRTELARDSAVAELHYQVANIGNVGQNIENLGWITLGLSFLLIFAAIALIHNTIRLALYANRFVIKSQELVGASWGFISRPYIVRGLLNGLWSAAIAIAALIAVQQWAQRLVPDLRALDDVNLLVAVFAGLVALGLLISGISTYVVVNKFLRMRVDDLY